MMSLGVELKPGEPNAPGMGQYWSYSNSASLNAGCRALPGDPLAKPWQRYYRRDGVTRCIPNGKRHRLHHAY